jgi:hypothetical protein
MNTKDRFYRIVVSHWPRKGEPREPLFFGQRASRSLPSLQDERKAVEKMAQGKPVLDMWTPAAKGQHIEGYIAYLGLFERGEYKGRASTYHHWRVVQ